MGKYDFVAVDFETANPNNNSACSIGLAAVIEKEIVKTEYHLIKPPTMYFSEKNINIHGIRPDDVKFSQTFLELWPAIQDYFIGNIIIAHNAIFDMSVLKLCLQEYKIDVPDFNFLCSIPISTRACRGQNIGRSLKERTKHFGVELANHHNALDDAIACANLVVQSIVTTRRKTFQSFCNTYSSLPIKNFKEFKPQNSLGKRRFENVRISEIAATTDNINSDHIFYEKNFVFTGELGTLSRRKAMQKVVNVGGIIKSGVSSKTDYLVVGNQDPSVVGKKGISTKEQKAHELREKGHHIILLSENEFLKALK